MLSGYMKITTPLQFDGRASVIGLEETEQVSGERSYAEIGTYYEVTTAHGPYEDFGTVAYVCGEELARLFSAAPELLAAMSDAAHDIDYVVSQPWSKRSQGDTDVLRVRLAAIRAAIAKATGNTSDAPAMNQAY